MSLSYTSRNAQYTIYFLRSCKTGIDRHGGVDMLINLIFNRLMFNILIAIGVCKTTHKKTYLFQIVSFWHGQPALFVKISINKIAFFLKYFNNNKLLKKNTSWVYKSGLWHLLILVHESCRTCNWMQGFRWLCQLHSVRRHCRRPNNLPSKARLWSTAETTRTWAFLLFWWHLFPSKGQENLF